MQLIAEVIDAISDGLRDYWFYALLIFVAGFVLAQLV